MKYLIFCTSGETPPTDKAFQTIVGAYEPWYIDIDTIEELQELVTKEGESIIVSAPSRFRKEWSIEIYDYYRE